MKFSERYGFTNIKSALQIDSIDDELWNSLRNCIHVCFFDVKGAEPMDSISSNTNFPILKEIWFEFLKKPIDELLSYTFNLQVYTCLKSYFFDLEWYEVYDFVEFMGEFRPNDSFITLVNNVLEREKAGYRFVSEKITPITNEQEIEAIESAINRGSQYAGVSAHLQEALNKLSDRENPDYRNSIKESVSAIESLCAEISGEKNATLGKTLGILEKKRGLHKSLKTAFSSIYGYTSDADGIRHAMMEESNVTFAKAKYMLVVCSAFVNYLIEELNI